jgi:hypothetical protein
MTTTITRKHTVVVQSTRPPEPAQFDRNYRGRRQYRNQARSVPTELSLSDFDAQPIDLSALQIVGVKVVHFAHGLGATVDVFGTVRIGEQPMHSTLHLGDAAHRFEAKGVEAWVKALGLQETARTPWQTSRQTGDVYEAISFGTVAASDPGDDAFSATSAAEAF